MKFILSFILSLCSVLGFSQTILYQAENTSRTVQDPQAVVLAQGFHASSTVANPFVAKIGPNTENPGGGPADSNAGSNNPSGTSVLGDQKFHDTKGNIEVNGAGQLQFTLPIALPPGVKSVSPNVSLIYMSNSGNGLAGFGWSLSGITNIARIGKNIEKDGELKSINLDYSDYYSFNGQRLVLKSGEYGKDGAEYVTEKYSNVKIKSVGAITGQTWKGPEYWEVTFEDGSQVWYGATSSGASTARTPIEYNIVKWKDAQGNYISYTYIQTRNVASVSSIKWGGNEKLNTPSINQITFNYLIRSLAEQSYVNGISLVQDRLLDNISVKTNNSLYTKYALEYGNNGTNYQFVNTITEYKSEGESANPVKFQYPQPTPISVDYDYIQSEDPFSNVQLTGDFNGDSYLDFFMYNGVVKLGGFNNDTFTNVPTNMYFNSSAVVVNTLLDEQGQIYNGNGIVQYIQGKVVGYIFRNNAFVKVYEKSVYDASVCDTVAPGFSCTTSAVINEADIDGDGVSNIFLSINQYSCYTKIILHPNGSTTEGETECFNSHIGKFIVDLKSPNLPVSTYVNDSGVDENPHGIEKYLDIDGDGKFEIINVSNTAYTVFEFIKTAPNQYLKKIKFSGSLMETKHVEFPILFGDFNGDGKLDFTIPVTDNASGKADNWRFYIGTGTGFTNFLKTEFFVYRNRQTEATGNYNKFAQQYFFSVADMNKDGKSDVVQVFSYNQLNLFNQNERNFGYTISTKLASGTAPDGTLNFTPTPAFQSPQYAVQDSDDKVLFTPLTNPIKANNNYYNIFLYWKKHLHRLRAPSPLSELGRVTSVDQGKGRIITEISYLEAVPGNANIYKKTKQEAYPYFSLERVDQTFVVSQLRQEGKKQDFRYRGMTAHLQGRGSIGYHQMARSSWYADGKENTKIWSGLEIDPQKFGQPIKEWAIRTNDENLIFPADISINNSLLLSFKQNSYSILQAANGVDIILPEMIVQKDFLTNVTSNKSITYGDYYLPASTQININNGFSIGSTTYEYINNPSGMGTDYYIGRPKSKTDVVKAYGDTKSAKEEYVYENNLLKTLKSWNRDNTGYLSETYQYDGFGNITQKLISNSMDSQIQNTGVLYDPTGRFVIKKTDNLGLETNISYTQWGQIEKQTDPLGNTLTNNYDVWGNLLSSKTNLAGTTSYQYERDADSNIKITQNDPDGGISKKYINKLGQEYKVSAKAFGQGQYVSSNTQYDILGRKTAESEPYFEGNTPGQWNTMVYDDSTFPAKVTAKAFNGKEVTTSISGLATTVKEQNGYARTTTKTSDALGNTVSSSDKGGVITFTYNAAGEQIQAKYEQNIVTTKYDSWGRRSEFNDPSNGIYKYEYDGFGQSTKTISPKGTKEYDYNNLGQLISQREISSTDGGQATHKIVAYHYDDKGRITSRSGTSKGKAYSSNVFYDPQGRTLSSSESSNGKYYMQKGITYDDKGRVVSYEKNLYSSGVLTKVTVENIYNVWNGELYQVKDKNSGKVLWELNQVNEKGQALKAKLGSVDIINSYDSSNGFLKEIKHSSAVKQSLLHVQYQFDAIKNELKSRVTGGDFNITESFDYDNNNRLVNWTNPVTGFKTDHAILNVYDAKGRILENDQVGKIKFENTAKIYQPTGMTLNAQGTQNYNNNLIQSIAYNENNDPVFIDGEKGDVAFQYGLTSMRQKVTYGGNFDPDQEGKLTKYYSEDGSFEILKDNITGKEKHILYIGGTPYESDILYLKDFTESNGSFKFLHKDYIGSILAISDEAGNKLEQRHFDAWGNFTHLQIGNDPVITDKNIINNTSLLVDRGYTSHEHFAEVGIIHMNGRLYDPLLRRFLNADENIQDPYNTQNYNKYGYVMNNPLMFNDPSGELWAAGFFLTWVAPVIWGTLVGTAVSAGLYIVKSLITGSWSWNGFARTLLVGAVSGGATGGILGSMSATSFSGAVVVGSMYGSISGGIDALFNGQNFFTGLYKGAVMGAAIGGVGYAISSLFTGNNSIADDIDYADAKGNRGIASNDKPGNKLNWFNKDSDGSLYKFAESDANVPEATVRIYTHGSPKGIQGPNGEWITTPETFDKILVQRSEIWKNYREFGGSIKVELMSCQTGRWGDGIASKLSKAFRNTEFIAPSTKFYAGPTNNGGTYSGIAGRFKFFNPGRWNHFINGKNITGLLDKYRYIQPNIWQQKKIQDTVCGVGCQ